MFYIEVPKNLYKCCVLFSHNNDKKIKLEQKFILCHRLCVFTPCLQVTSDPLDQSLQLIPWHIEGVVLGIQRNRIPLCSNASKQYC